MKNCHLILKVSFMFMVNNKIEGSKFLKPMSFQKCYVCVGKYSILYIYICLYPTNSIADFIRTCCHLHHSQRCHLFADNLSFARPLRLSTFDFLIPRDDFYLIQTSQNHSFDSTLTTTSTDFYFCCFFFCLQLSKCY
uniref:Uncharacterized protein n=1 Tax=Rousettus aegyptiacus TaxID=9407 RepID=A0A7J8FJ96_ROUAE|nr:hypothetical protein HJG63_011951 [Rousettus aegyptiacus]